MNKRLRTTWGLWACLLCLTLGARGQGLLKATPDASTAALFPFDEGAGSLAGDLGPHSYHPTFPAGVSWSSDNAASLGATGASISLNGTSQYVTVPRLLDAWPATGGLSFWFRPNAAFPVSGAPDMRLFQKINTESGGAPNNEIDVYVATTASTNAPAGAIVVKIISAGTDSLDTFHSSTTSWGAGTWHHVGLTWTAGDDQGKSHWRLFIDAALQDSTTWPLPAPGTTRPAVLGAYYGGGTPSNYANCAYDQLHVWSQAVPSLTVSAEAAHATPNNQTENTRWVKSAANPVLTATQTWEGTAVQEPCLLMDVTADAQTPAVVGGKYQMYYTGGFGTTAQGLAQSVDLTTWTKPRTTPVIGQGQGGESGNIVRPLVFRYGGTYYDIYASGSPGGLNTDLKIATSTDGQTFTGNATLIAHGTGAGGGANWNQGLQNSCVWLDGSGVWHLWVEGWVGTPTYWRTAHYTATAPSGPYTLQQFPATGLARTATGMYGGPCVLKVGGVYQMWHTGTLYHDLPTDIYRDSSPDLVNWAHYLVDPVLSIGDASFEVDQVADPSVFQAGVSCYMLYDGLYNATSTSSIGLATYAGTLAQLVTDSPLVAAGYSLTVPAGPASIVAILNAQPTQTFTIPSGTKGLKTGSQFTVSYQGVRYTITVGVSQTVPQSIYDALHNGGYI